MAGSLEPYHAVNYFVPESRAATDALGGKGGWMSYFGLRAAPLGPAPAEVVTALFYNSHPDRVRRAVPAAWQGARRSSPSPPTVGQAEAGPLRE